MKLNPNNDVYPGDLSILNIRKQQWAKGEDRSQIYNIATIVILVAGLLCMILVNKKFGGTTMMSQLPLHITIWVTALLAFLFSRKGKQLSQAPFFGFHDARFETDDDTLYYRFQKGMTLRTFIIKDNKIHKITRDDEWGVILIEGDGTVLGDEGASDKGNPAVGGGNLLAGDGGDGREGEKQGEENPFHRIPSL